MTTKTKPDADRKPAIALNSLLTPDSGVDLESVFTWADKSYRSNIFKKDQVIRTRPGLIYLVSAGVVRVVGDRDNLLSIVSSGQPFETISSSSAVAHINDTKVVWLYEEDLKKWPGLEHKLLQAFRFGYQQQLAIANAFSLTDASQRLLEYLTVTILDLGIAQSQGLTLPFPLTHNQLASIIGTTRVTVTRVIQQLKKQQQIGVTKEGFFYLPSFKSI